MDYVLASARFGFGVRWFSVHFGFSYLGMNQPGRSCSALINTWTFRKSTFRIPNDLMLFFHAQIVCIKLFGWLRSEESWDSMNLFMVYSTYSENFNVFMGACVIHNKLRVQLFQYSMNEKSPNIFQSTRQLHSVYANKLQTNKQTKKNCLFTWTSLNILFAAQELRWESIKINSNLIGRFSFDRYHLRHRECFLYLALITKSDQFGLWHV